MKRVLILAALGAAGLLPAAPASAEVRCVYWGGTGIHVVEPLEREQIAYIPLYQVDPHCLDHLIPPH